MVKIIDLSTYYYKKNQIDELLNNKSNIDHTHSQYLTQHQDISGKVDKSGHAPNKNLATNDNGILITEDKPIIPTKTSDLTNDSGFVTIDNIPELNISGLNISNKADKTGWTPNKNIITNNDGELTTEDIITKTSQLSNDAGFITLNDVPERFSGSYNDLTDKPNIPIKTSQLNNDSGYITINNVPTKTSQLNNDNGYITINDLPEENDVEEYLDAIINAYS